MDGYILQSPVSDRESAFLFMSPEVLDRSVQVAKDMIERGQSDNPMPKLFLPGIFSTPVTAYRWHSLAAKECVESLTRLASTVSCLKCLKLTNAGSGDDDYFSSDLPDARLAATFGRLDKPVLLMPAGEDEMVPPSVDRKALLARWMSFCRAGLASELSGLIPGADHVVSQPEAQQWVAERVGAFLESI